jgi:hypothetical protein
MKFIGTIIDRSYFLPYHKEKDGRLYIYKICEWCGEEAEMGYSKLDHSNAVIAPNHHCQRDKHLYCAAESPREDGFLFIKNNGQ